MFPRVKRRLLQLKEETAETLSVPTIDAITNQVQKTKMDAQEVCTSCGIHLESYADKGLVSNVEKIVEHAIVNDQEEKDNSAISESMESNSSCSVQPEEAVTIQKDLSLVRLKKAETGTIPTYETVEDSGDCSHKTFRLKNKKQSSPFVLYKGTYIRKTTALYLLQEGTSVSNDRLLRVRADQPKHIFSSLDVDKCGPNEIHSSRRSMCFSRVDCKEKCLIDR